MLCAAIVLGFCTGRQVRAEPPAEKQEATDEAKVVKATKTIRLFDGKSLKGWRVLKKYEFEDHGKVAVNDGELVLPEGKPMTGIAWTGKLPSIDYELTFQARRIDGDDFFCGLTFPVGKSHCSLILGGWGGGVTGLSCIDGYDASENETSSWREFKQKQWYRVRVQVTAKKIACWLDKEQIVDADITGRQVSLRLEMEDMPPLGFATWQTSGGLKDIVMKPLAAENSEASE
jgi:hypothetical protein